MSMLSRVASNIYWLGRYLERAENSARIMNVNSNLLLDLPKTIRLGWQPIIEIVSAQTLFKQLYSEANELNVAHFIITDTNNPGSILSSLISARENARTIREVIPREAWEQINILYLLAKDAQADIANQRHRYVYLNKIILANQAITGILSGTMTHDAGYEFLRLGRNIERADMTTRILDVRSSTLLPDIEPSQAPFENIQWMSVLKSLTGYQMYRREMRVRVKREDVLCFLLQNNKFPRSLGHILHQVQFCLSALPNNSEALTEVKAVQQQLIQVKPRLLKQDKLHEFIDDIQLGLNEIHSKTAKTYF
jgi:uncharacterized alpha-E superfamily protein